MRSKRLKVWFVGLAVAILLAACSLRPGPVHLGLVVDSASHLEGREAQQAAVEALLSTVQPGDTLKVYTHGEPLFKGLVRSGTVEARFIHAPANQPFPVVVAEAGRALAEGVRPGQPAVFVILANDTSDALGMADFRGLPRGTQIRLIGTRITGALPDFLQAGQLPYDVQMVSNAALLAPATAEVRGEIRGLRRPVPTPWTWGMLLAYLGGTLLVKLRRWRQSRRPMEVLVEVGEQLRVVSLRDGQTVCLPTATGAPGLTLSRDGAEVHLVPQEEVCVGRWRLTKKRCRAPNQACCAGAREPSCCPRVKALCP